MSTLFEAASIQDLLYGLLGLGAGIVQIAMLGRSVRGRGHAFGFIVRLGIPALVLVLAASMGHLGAAGIGWAVGFALTAAVTYRRLR